MPGAAVLQTERHDPPVTAAVSPEDWREMKPQFGSAVRRRLVVIAVAGLLALWFSGAYAATMSVAAGGGVCGARAVEFLDADIAVAGHPLLGQS